MRARLVVAACVTLAGLALATGCTRDDPGAGDGDGGTTSTTVAEVLTPDAIPVLRAARPIPAGTEATAAFEEGLIEATTVARADFPVDGVVTLELVEGRQAVADIPAGTLLTISHFSP